MAKEDANPEDNKGDKGDEGDKGVTVESLQKQIENLNKGIATYRDDAKKAVDEARAAKQEVLDAKKALEDATKARKTDDGDKLAPLSPEDQKRLEQWAKQQGFATKEEIIEERQRIQGETLKNVETQAIDEFTKAHPEYEKEEVWDKLKAEFSQYKQPVSLSEYRRILNKIHKELNPSDEGASRARAEIESRRRLGLGGGSQRSTGEEMTVEKLTEKYPNLSKDQIETRLAEINALYPKDKK